MSNLAGASERILLSESQLIHEAMQSNPPNLQDIELALLSARLGQSQTNENFSPALQLGVQQSKSNEISFSAFIPVTQESQTAKAQVAVPTQQGMALSLKAQANQFTNSLLRDATTTSIGAGLVIDLNKNLQGKNSKSLLRENEFNVEYQQKLKSINTQAFINGIRKMYWSVVANEEAIKITKTLFQSAIKLSLEAKKRFNDSVADSGEVARYEALVASREGKLTTLEYQREKIIMELMQILPGLANMQAFGLEAYDIDQTLMQVLSCTQYIQGQHETPLANTFYDEAVQQLRASYEEKLAQRHRHADWDLKLEAEVNKLGKDYSYSASRENFASTSQMAWGAGINLAIPLDRVKSTTQEMMEEIETRRFVAQSENYLSRMKAYHTQVALSVTYLQNVILLQKKNAMNLEHSLKITKRKYQQARLSLNELITEQDTFFANELDQISTKLTVIHTVLDYLSIFTETPCALNQTKLGKTL